MGMKTHGIKGIAGGFCLMLASLVFIFTITEIGLRVFGYSGLQNLEDGRELILQPSSNVNMKYELIPGASGNAWGTHVELNERGYRGRMGTPGHFPGFRIIALGDSITFGNSLPLGSTYPSQLQQMLDKSATDYEVLNFGVGGYDIIQEVALLEHRALSYEPDLVVIGFCLNDVFIASPNLEYIERIQKYKSNRILRSFRLVQYIVNTIDRIRIGTWMREKNQPEVFARDYEGMIAVIGEEEHELRDLIRRVPDEFPSKWYKNELRIGRLRYGFERIAALAEKENFSVVVLTFPWLVGDSTFYPHQLAHSIVELEARRTGFDVLDMLKEFTNAGMDNLRINDMVHPNEKGHRLVAEKLKKYVLDKQQASLSN